MDKDRFRVSGSKVKEKPHCEGGCLCEGMTTFTGESCRQRIVSSQEEWPMKP